MWRNGLENVSIRNERRTFALISQQGTAHRRTKRSVSRRNGRPQISKKEKKRLNRSKLKDKVIFILKMLRYLRDKIFNKKYFRELLIKLREIVDIFLTNNRIPAPKYPPFHQILFHASFFCTQKRKMH